MKFIKKFINIIINITLLPISLIIFIIAPIVFFRFGVLSIGRIGDVLQFQHYLKQKNDFNNSLNQESIKTQNKLGFDHSNTIWKKGFFNIDILSLSRQCCNKQIKISLQRNYYFINSIITRLIINNLNFVFGHNNKFVISFNRGLPHLEISQNQLFDFKFTKKEIDYCLKTLNLNQNSKWICIHNRDTGYLDKYLSENKSITLPRDYVDFSYHDFRNFSIKTMIPLAKYFADNNLNVFRIGKESNENLNLNHPRIVDLVNNKKRTDLLEIFLLSKCYFFVGSDSGPWVIPFMNNIPTIKSNYTSLGQLEKIKHNHLFIILKRLRFKYNKKLLTIKDVFEMNLETMEVDYEASKLGLEFIDNDAETLLQSSIELNQRINNNYIETENSLSKQKKFWDLIHSYSKEKNKLKTRVIIGSYFLEKNMDLLNE